MPSASASSPPRPSRTMSWSSTTRTRIIGALREAASILESAAGHERDGRSARGRTAWRACIDSPGQSRARGGPGARPRAAGGTNGGGMAATSERRTEAAGEQPAPPAPGRDDIEPVLHETRDRIITGTVTVVPFLALGIVAWQLWNSLLHWHDLVVFVLLYAFSGLGVTVGFHRLFTHRSFKTSPFMRGLFAIAGSSAIEGPVISWVADHRKHHAFSDQPG